MADRICPGSEPSKVVVRRSPKGLRIDIPRHHAATGARLEPDGQDRGFLLHFSGSQSVSWTPQYINYRDHLGPDVTLIHTAEWVERMIKGAGYRTRRVKSGDKTVAAWAVSLGPGSS